MPAVVDEDCCVGCGACVDECPAESIKMVDDIAKVDVDTCVDCGACVDACPSDCIKME